MAVNNQTQGLDQLRTIQRIKETNRWLFEKTIKIDKHLSKQIKRQRENIQIIKIRNGKGEITTDAEEIQRIIGSYFKEAYSIKWENLKFSGQFIGWVPYIK